MAVTIANRKKSVEGNRATVYCDVTGPASYAAGGEVLSQADLNQLVGKPGARIGDIIEFAAEATGTNGTLGGHALILDRTNSKIAYFNGTTQIAGATNLSTFTSRVAVTSLVNG